MLLLVFTILATLLLSCSDAIVFTVLATLLLSCSAASPAGSWSPLLRHNDSSRPARSRLVGGSLRRPTAGSLEYYLFEPEPQVEAGQATRRPLLVWLHGYGTRIRPSDGGAWIRPTHQRAHPCFVLVPQAPPAAGSWAPGRWPGIGSHPLPPPPMTVSLLMGLVDALVETHPIDPLRLMVGGASMGGYGAWDLATRYPARFGVVIPICGGGDPARAAKALRCTRVWAFHAADDGTVPVAASRQMMQSLSAARALPLVPTALTLRDENATVNDQLRYTEYASGGHAAAWQRPFAPSDQRVVEWAHRRLAQWPGDCIPPSGDEARTARREARAAAQREARGA